MSELARNELLIVGEWSGQIFWKKGMLSYC